MNYYNQIKEQLLNNEVYKKVKDYSKNKNELETYYNVGKLIIEAQGGEERAKYGDNLIKEYSKKLINEVGKKYNERTLRRIRQFYLLFKDEKWSTLSTKLTWSHYCEILPSKNIDEISYYVKISNEQNLSVRDLRKRIQQNEYQRLSIETKEKLINKEENQIQHYMNYIDKNIKTINQNKTIGIIICKKDDKYVMEYCSDSRIYRSTYELV